MLLLSDEGGAIFNQGNLKRQTHQHSRPPFLSTIEDDEGLGVEMDLDVAWSLENGAGEGVRTDFHRGHGQRFSPSHYHPKVWHVSSVGHAVLIFIGTGRGWKLH